MKKRFSLSLLTMAIAAVMTTVSARTRQLFDSGWQFTRNGKTIAVNLPHDWDIYDPHAEVLDIVGYNYMIHKHASDHKRDPQRVMWQTESYPRDAFNNV